MNGVRKVTEDLYWVGVNDKRIELFENIHPIPEGVSYNAYLLLDEKTVLFDTVDWSGCRVFLENIAAVLDGRKLDYLVVNHMEPDHAASLEEVLIRYPECKVISNEKAFMFMRQFGFDVDGREDTVKEGDTRCFGKHTVTFLMAQMVHWPEAMVTFDTTNGVLFSADAFGSFGSLDGRLFDDEVNFDRDWIDNARRYFTNIVGKYGTQVQQLLKKVVGLDIKMICPLHGPILKENLNYYINKYDTWSSYKPEDEGILVAYNSIHGNTKKAVEELEKMLKENGVKKVVVSDLSRNDMSETIANAFRYDKLIIASPTYDTGLFPSTEKFLRNLKHKNYQNRRIGIIENGSWAPMAAKCMNDIIKEMKNIETCNTTVTIKTRMNDESKKKMKELVKELLNK